MIKTGEQHLRTLRDGRRIYLNGGLVEDPTAHPAFRNAIASIGRLYDFQSRPANRELMTFEDPGRPGGSAPTGSGSFRGATRTSSSGARPSKRGPSCTADFSDARRTTLPRASPGCTWAGRVFEDYDGKRAAALAGYYRHARDHELYLTYVIINPQADRSRAAHEQADEFLTAGVVDEDAEGLTIRGAKMLATGGIMANEVFVTCIQPLQPGDEKYAVSFAVPMNAPGLKILSRKSYEEHAPSVYDNPLAHRFDENDAVLYFDDVKVPWDRVFVNQDTGMCLKQFHDTPAHVYQNYQAQIRLMVKMRFFLGVAKRIADTNGVTSFPQVREILGNLAAEAIVVDSLVHAMRGQGPAARCVLPSRSAHPVRGTGDHPAALSADDDHAAGPRGRRDDHAAVFGRRLRAPRDARDDRQDPRSRRPATPRAGSSSSSSPGTRWARKFASRHTQYEMFYAGATFVTKGHSFRTFDWDRCTGMVDQMLDSYTLEDELARLQSAAPA